MSEDDLTKRLSHLEKCIALGLAEIINYLGLQDKKFEPSDNLVEILKLLGNESFQPIFSQKNIKKITDNTLVKNPNSLEVLKRPKYQERISSKYLCDFESVYENKFLSDNYTPWLKEIKDCNYEMKKSIKENDKNNLFYHARLIIEITCPLILEKMLISEYDIRFLQAFIRLKQRLQYVPALFIDNNNTYISSEKYIDYKNGYFLDKDEIKTLCRTNLPFAVSLILESVKTNFFQTQSAYKTNFIYLRDGINFVRNAIHHKNKEEQNTEKFRNYYSPDIQQIQNKIKPTLEWFVKDISVGLLSESRSI